MEKIPEISIDLGTRNSLIKIDENGKVMIELNNKVNLIVEEEKNDIKIDENKLQKVINSVVKEKNSQNQCSS